MLTTTMLQMKTIIEVLTEKGIRKDVKVIIGACWDNPTICGIALVQMDTRLMLLGQSTLCLCYKLNKKQKEAIF